MGRPWLRARRLVVPVALYRVFAWRVGGVPPDLLVDAYLAERQAGHERPLIAFQETWLARRREITNAAELARYTRERAWHGVPTRT